MVTYLILLWMKHPKKVLESEDVGEIKAAIEELTQVSHKLAEAMYARAAKEQASAQSDTQTDAGNGGDGQAKDKDNVVDADFEEVK